jgi:hypothetical protein
VAPPPAAQARRRRGVDLLLCVSIRKDARQFFSNTYGTLHTEHVGEMQVIGSSPDSSMTFAGGSVRSQVWSDTI